MSAKHYPTRQRTMVDSAERRRKVAARQILDAMTEKGLTRAQLADLMGRSRSEATKWLSGKHNFTLDLLSELSQVLGRPITGVEEGTYSSAVCGYGSQTKKEAAPKDTAAELKDPAAELIDLQPMIVARAKAQGLSVGDYIRNLVAKDMEESLPVVRISGQPGRLVRKYSGIVKATEVAGDEKFDRIWNR